MNIGPLKSQNWDIIGDIDWGNIHTNLPDLIAVIGRIVTAAYAMAGVAAVLFIIYGGYSIMIATGDPQKLKKGQDTLAYAFVGLVVVIASGALLRYIAALLGVEDEILNFNIPFV